MVEDIVVKYKQGKPETAQWIDSYMNLYGMINSVGAWEKHASDEAWDKAVADYRALVRLMIGKDMAVGKYPSLPEEAAPLLSKPLTELINNLSDMPFDKSGKFNFRVTECTPETLPYNAFAYILSMELPQNKRLNDMLYHLYFKRYTELAVPAEDYASLFDQEFLDSGMYSKEDRLLTADGILGYFICFVRDGDDYDSEKLAHAQYFLLYNAFQCGHILPYTQIAPCETMEYCRLQEERNGYSQSSSINAVFDELNGFRDQGHADVRNIDPSDFVKTGLGKDMVKQGLSEVSQRQEKDRLRGVLFSKYLRERRKALADYFFTTPEDLARTIVDEELDSLQEKGDTFFTVEKGFMHGMISPIDITDSLKEKDMAMLSDVISQAIRTYYAAKLSRILDEMLEDAGDEPIQTVVTKHDIIHEIGMEDIAEDGEYLTSVVMFAVQCIIIQKLCQVYLSTYYQKKERHAGHNGQIEKYRSEIREQESRISRMEIKIRELESEIKALNSRKRDGEEIVPLSIFHDMRRSLITEMEEKDKKIAELEDRIDERDDYIALLEKTAEEPEEQSAAKLTDEEMAFLSTKRFVFVCGNIDAIYPRLRKMFPASFFFESENLEPAKEVDAVIYIIPHISHSLYYKAKNAYQGLPWLNFIQKNFDILLRQMVDMFDHTEKKKEE